MGGDVATLAGGGATDGVAFTGRVEEAGTAARTAAVSDASDVVEVRSGAATPVAGRVEDLAGVTGDPAATTAAVRDASDFPPARGDAAAVAAPRSRA